MDNFVKFSSSVAKNIDSMAKSQLFVTSVDKDQLWSLYLASFPPGSNEVFRERTTHDCNCCRNFIRNYGNIVSVVENSGSYSLKSIWDLDLDLESSDPVYGPVARSLAEFVKQFPISNVFMTDSPKMGAESNRDSKNPDLVFHHFYGSCPQHVFRIGSIDAALGEIRTTKEVFFRGLSELTTDSFETVIDLIAQNQIYRGQEFLASINSFYRDHQFFLGLDPVSQDLFAWSNTKWGHTRLRNTAIGTLLCDLSGGLDVASAVTKYEKMVAPQNYKRPTALISKRMIEDAQKVIQELGIEDSLYRRHASLSDITINNVLFADRQTKVALNVFDELKAEAKIQSKVQPHSKNQLDPIGIQDFIQNVLPLAHQIEVEPENHHLANLVSLIAPEVKSPNILKWGNNFSWVYKGSVTDSLKEKVKKAGGNVDAALRCSLEWYNYDDLDIHAIEPSGNHIYFSQSNNFRTSGSLDIDMNRTATTREAVENIVWTDKNKMEEGNYRIFVHNYNQRESVDVGFRVEMEYDGQVYEFVYDKRVSGNVDVVEFNFSRAQGLTILNSLPLSKSSKEAWNIHTQKMNKVTAIMKSPNHWDDNGVGNLHWFFMLENCQNPDPVRGLFNEYLKGELDKHRKVLEVLGNKLMVKPVPQQLSGLGFSSTKREHLVCKVKGQVNRMFKIQF